jgi:hypothetical protein
MPRASSHLRASIVVLLLVLLGAAGIRAGAQDREPDKFFRQYIGLNDGQIEAIRGGKAVAKVLESRTPNEVFIFGAVYIDAAPESYLKLAGDIAELRKLPGYLAIHRFSNPPQLSDLEGFTVGSSEVKDLKNCKPGDCDFQLPAEAMEEFQRSVNWAAPDAADQASRLARQMTLQALERYIQGGNAALGVYRDKNHPAAVAETFKSLLSRLEALPAYVPELDRYLLEYPEVTLANADSEFYWEKVNFGLKPTFRVVQRIVYRGAPGEPAYVVAQKQLYSNHYFQAALDLTGCVRDTAQTASRGFYLITLKASQQAGLTGFKGSIVRKAAVDKSRSSLEKTLASIKRRLEGSNWQIAIGS